MPTSPILEGLQLIVSNPLVTGNTGNFGNFVFKSLINPYSSLTASFVNLESGLYNGTYSLVATGLFTGYYQTPIWVTGYNLKSAQAYKEINKNCYTVIYTGYAEGWGGWKNLSFGTGIIAVTGYLITTGNLGTDNLDIGEDYVYHTTGTISGSKKINVSVTDLPYYLINYESLVTGLTGLTCSDPTYIKNQFRDSDNQLICAYYEMKPVGLFSGNLTIPNTNKRCKKPIILRGLDADTGCCAVFDPTVSIVGDISGFSDNWAYESQRIEISGTNKKPDKNNDAALITRISIGNYISYLRNAYGTGYSGYGQIDFYELGTGYNEIFKQYSTSQDAWASYDVKTGMNSKKITAFTITIVSGISGAPISGNPPFIIWKPTSYQGFCVRGVPQLTASNSAGGGGDGGESSEQSTCEGTFGKLWEAAKAGDCATIVIETEEGGSQKEKYTNVNNFKATSSMALDDMFGSVMSGSIFFNNPVSGDSICFNSYNYDYINTYKSTYNTNPPFSGLQFCLSYPQDFSNITGLKDALNSILNNNHQIWIPLSELTSGSTSGLFILTPLMTGYLKSTDEIGIRSLVPGPFGNYLITIVSESRPSTKSSSYLLPQDICLQVSNNNSDWTGIFCESGIDWTKAIKLSPVRYSFVINSGTTEPILTKPSGSTSQPQLTGDNDEENLLNLLNSDPSFVLCTVSGAWKVIKKEDYIQFMCQGSQGEDAPKPVNDGGTGVSGLGIEGFSSHSLSGCLVCDNTADSSIYEWKGAIFKDPYNSFTYASHYFSTEGYWYPTETGRLGNKILFNKGVGGARLFYNTGIESWSFVINCASGSENIPIWSGNKVANLDTSGLQNSYSGFIDYRNSVESYGPSGIYQRFGGCNTASGDTLLSILPIDEAGGSGIGSFFNIKYHYEIILKTGVTGSNANNYDYYRIYLSNFTSGDTPLFKAKNICLFGQQDLAMPSGLGLSGNSLDIVGASYTGKLFDLATGIFTGNDISFLAPEDRGRKLLSGYVTGRPAHWVSLNYGLVDAPIPTGHPYFVGFRRDYITGSGYYSKTFSGDYFYFPETNEVTNSVTFGANIIELGIISGTLNVLTDEAINNLLTYGGHIQTIYTGIFADGLIPNALYEENILSVCNTGITTGGIINSGSGYYLIDIYLTGNVPSGRSLSPTGYTYATGTISYNNLNEFDSIFINENEIFYSASLTGDGIFKDSGELIDIINAGTSGIYMATAISSGANIFLTSIQRGITGNSILISGSAGFSILNGGLTGGQEIYTQTVPSGMFSGYLRTTYTNTGFYIGSGTGVIYGEVPIWFGLRTFTGVWDLYTGLPFEDMVGYNYNSWISGNSYVNTGTDFNLGTVPKTLKTLVRYNNIYNQTELDVANLVINDTLNNTGVSVLISGKI